MSVLNGTLFTIKHGASPTAIPLQVDCSISLAQGTREAVTKDGGGARTVLAGVRSASASFSGLLDLTANDLTELTGYMTNGTTVAFEIGAVGGVGSELITITATGILTGLDISGGTEDNVQISGSFELNWPSFTITEA